MIFKQKIIKFPKFWLINVLQKWIRKNFDNRMYGEKI